MLSFKVGSTGFNPHYSRSPGSRANDFLPIPKGLKFSLAWVGSFKRLLEKGEPGPSLLPGFLSHRTIIPSQHSFPQHATHHDVTLPAPCYVVFRSPKLQAKPKSSSHLVSSVLF